MIILSRQGNVDKSYSPEIVLKMCTRPILTVNVFSISSSLKRVLFGCHIARGFFMYDGFSCSSDDILHPDFLHPVRDI